MVLSVSRVDAQNYTDIQLARKGKEETIRGELDKFLGLASQRHLSVCGLRSPAWQFGKQKETEAVLCPFQTSLGPWWWLVQAGRGSDSSHLYQAVRLQMAATENKPRDSGGFLSQVAVLEERPGSSKGKVALGEFTFLRDCGRL